MHLDRNGKKVYLVHQQDRSVKAQPGGLDIWKEETIFAYRSSV